VRQVAKTLIAFSLFCLFTTTSCHNNKQNSPNQITVAAAADLAPAFEEAGRAFEQQHSTKVIFSFGSSGMLAKQIENGAPFDVFASANTEYVEELDRKGLIASDTKAVYARGRITLWTIKDSPLKIEKINDLARPEVKRIAIANPEHAPYGMIAREALQNAGVWETVQPRVIYGENIRQTLQYAQTGNVDVAIVALSLSLQSGGRWVLVPEELHRPLDQMLGVIKASKREQTAREFATFINAPDGRRILRKYGLTLPNEVVPP
jgi:molybdate transport system substrate-binding protein